MKRHEIQVKNQILLQLFCLFLVLCRILVGENFMNILKLFSDSTLTWSN